MTTDVAGAPRAQVLAAAVLWGTTGTAQALGPAGTTPASVGALRIVVGAVGLAAAAVVARQSLRGAVHVRASRPLLLGAAAVAAYQVCFFSSMERAGVAVGTLVAIGSAPVWTGLGTFLLSGGRFDRGWAPATALAVAGCALLVLPGSAGAAQPLGVGLSLGAGASYAAFTLAGKRLLGLGFAPTPAMASMFAGGAVVLLPLLAPADLTWLATRRGVAMVAWLGLAATALSYVLFARGLARLHPATVATLSLAEPLTAAGLGVVLLRERPGLVGVAGGVLLIGGLALASLQPVLASRRCPQDRR